LLQIVEFLFPLYTDDKTANQNVQNRTMTPLNTSTKKYNNSS